MITYRGHVVDVGGPHHGAADAAILRGEDLVERGRVAALDALLAQLDHVGRLLANGHGSHPAGRNQARLHVSRLCVPLGLLLKRFKNMKLS